MLLQLTLTLQLLCHCFLPQIVKSPPPEWEAEYKAWTQMRKAREGMIKQYPALVRRESPATATAVAVAVAVAQLRLKQQQQ